MRDRRGRGRNKGVINGEGRREGEKGVAEKNERNKGKE
jgi:hypothetical protein